MTREEKISRLKDILSEINENDNAVCYLTSEDNELIESAIKALSQESCYNPDEWCHDCSEYNQDKHCCPRFNKVIRNAVKEMKDPKMGHWIYERCDMYSCSVCRHWHTDLDEKMNYCPNCGARMVEPQESEG